MSKNIDEDKSIKDAFLSGVEALKNGKSIYFDPFRNRGKDYSFEQNAWHEGYNFQTIKNENEIEIEIEVENIIFKSSFATSEKPLDITSSQVNLN